MKKRNATIANKPSRKGEKKGKTITTTSVVFKTPTLEGLKSHDLVVNHDRSVSWVVNQLCEKFLAGDVKLS